jgi:hypothetical protein
MSGVLFQLTIDNKTCIIERSSNHYVVNFLENKTWLHSTRCLVMEEAQGLAENFLGIKKTGPSLLVED